MPKLEFASVTYSIVKDDNQPLDGDLEGVIEVTESDKTVTFVQSKYKGGNFTAKLKAVGDDGVPYYK